MSRNLDTVLNEGITYAEESTVTGCDEQTVDELQTEAYYGNWDKGVDRKLNVKQFLLNRITIEPLGPTGTAVVIKPSAQSGLPACYIGIKDRDQATVVLNTLVNIMTELATELK